MSKNAFVLDDHYGDDGYVTPGMILRDVTSKRFEVLEKQGLVREATSEELKDGYTPPFEAGAAEKEAAKPDNKQAPEAPNKAAPKPATKAA
jgi:hypothetical protein